jgi:hypothetical protein
MEDEMKNAPIEEQNIEPVQEETPSHEPLVLENPEVTVESKTESGEVIVEFKSSDGETVTQTLTLDQLQNIKTNTEAHIEHLKEEFAKVSEDDPKYEWYTKFIPFSETALAQVNDLIAKAGG